MQRPIVLTALVASFAAVTASAAQEPNAGNLRVIVTPPNPVVTAGDTLRLSARVVDAAGNAVAGARVRFAQQGARFEAEVDSLGLVIAGVTGTVPVAVAAILHGQRPIVQRVDVRIVPGPAATIEAAPASARLAVGQRLHIRSTVKSKTGDVRTGDAVSWRSSVPNVVRIDNDGMATAVAAGRATLTASSGAASGTVNVQVVNASVASSASNPARATPPATPSTASPSTGPSRRGRASSSRTAHSWGMRSVPTSSRPRWATAWPRPS
jgi:trimeric autotransporter adhesin